MKKHVWKLFAMLCAVLLLASLAGGCKPAEDTGSGDGSLDIPEELVGTEIVYAHYKDPRNGDEGPTTVLDDFIEKSGINIKVDVYPQDTYYEKIISLIATDNSPDIFFDNNMFPHSLSMAEPVNKVTDIDVTDPFWDQLIIKMSTFNGNTYGLAAEKGLLGGGDLVYFNKTVMEEEGIKTPAEYYADGEWTYANMKKCAQEYKALGEYHSGLVDQAFLGMFPSNGTDFVKFAPDPSNNNDYRFTSNLSDPKLIETARFCAELRSENLMDGSLTEFIRGFTGMLVIDQFGLQQGGYLAEMDQSRVGYAPIPVPEQGDEEAYGDYWKCFMIAKGAKNPRAAGYFLRYYLDFENNWSDKLAPFASEEAADFFWYLKTRPNRENRTFQLSNGVAYTVGNSIHGFGHNLTFETAPDQVTTELQQCAGIIDSAVKKANELLSNG